MSNLDDLNRQRVACLLLAIRFEENYPSLRRELRALLATETETLPIFSQVLKTVSQQSWNRAQAEYDLALKSAISIVSIFDPAYPDSLRAIPDPPLILYIKGVVPKTAFSIAIVGARAGTRAACQFASQLAKQISELGGQVVSGLALGIDGAAHRGALAAENKISPGIAVLGSGLECIYPAAHKNLAMELVERGGALISEYSLRACPMKHHFPERNRIISGLSDFVLVVEASTQSGSLITARLALEQGRDVGAVPGAINNSKNAGTNELIAQGALLVRNLEDIASAVPKIKQAVLKDQKTMTKLRSKQVSQAAILDVFTSDSERERAKKILEIIEHEGKVQLDLIVEASGFSFLAVQEVLNKLELAGRVLRGAGEYYEVGGANF